MRPAWHHELETPIRARATYSCAGEEELLLNDDSDAGTCASPDLVPTMALNAASVASVGLMQPCFAQGAGVVEVSVPQGIHPREVDGRACRIRRDVPAWHGRARGEDVAQQTAMHVRGH